MSDFDFREPERARRIRERDRLLARGRRRAASTGWFDRPVDHARDPETGVFEVRRFWHDAEGACRPGPCTWDEVFEARDLRARRLLDTPHPCSSYCCGNPRRWFGTATRQEVRADLAAAEQFEALGLRFRGRFRHEG